MRQLSAKAPLGQAPPQAENGPGSRAQQLLDEVWTDQFRLLCMDNLLSSGEESIYFKDRSSRFLLVSRKWLETYAGGRPLEQVVGHTDADMFSSAHAEDALSDEQRVMETGLPIERKLERETFWEAPDAWAETTKMPLRDRNGEIIGTFGVTRDVTHEHRAMSRQAALAKVGDALAGATTLQDVYEAVLSGAIDLTVGSVSRAAVVVTGGRVPSVAAMTPDPVRHPHLLETTARVLGEGLGLADRAVAVQRDNVWVVPIGALGHGRQVVDGSRSARMRWLGALVLESNAGLSQHSLQALTWLASAVGVILDNLLTARRLRSLVARAADGLLVVTQDGTVRYGADSLERSFGRHPDELLGRDVAELVHPDDQRHLSEALSSPTDLDGSVLEVRWHHADGSWRATETTVADLRGDPEVEGVALSLRDVTDHKALEMELRQAQKLQAIGQLAGGVAHEINTPIQFIADNLQFLHEAFESIRSVVEAYRVAVASLPSDGPEPLQQRLAALEEQADLEFLEQEIPNAVSQALEGSRRVAKIVQALKAFGHPDRGEPVATDLNESLRNSVIMARGETKYVADVIEELGDLPPIMVVPGDIGQVFLNLLVNAGHAITDKVGGTAQRGRIVVKSWCEGDDVFVSVSDDGAGMPEEVAQRVFEPFFTTKEVGRGTGQGLALAKTVVERHGGSIRFESAVGLGTTFIIRLPVKGQPPAA